jgi:superoxide dismutase
MERNRGSGLHLLSSLRDTNKRSTLRPFSNRTTTSSVSIRNKKKHFIDHHAEMIKKIDALLTEVEKENEDKNSGKEGQPSDQSPKTILSMMGNTQPIVSE